MRYKNLEIIGFRGIRKAKIEDLSRINIFVGQNNSGKSSILEALFLLTGFNSPSLVLSIDMFRNLMHNDVDDFRFTFYNLDYKNPTIISSDLFDENSSRKLQILPLKSKVVKEAIKNTFSSGSISSTADYNAIENVYPIMDDSDEDVNGIEFKCEIKEFHTEKKVFNSMLTLSKTADGIEFIREPDKKKYIGFRGLMQGTNFRRTTELIKRIENIIISKKKDNLIIDLKKIESKISDIVTGENSMIFVDVGASRMVPSNLMGDGFLKFLNVIVNFSDAKDGVMLIDEIDNGLHYQSLKKLWKIILDAAKSNNTQLFLTTHSKETLIFLKEVLEEEGMQEHKEFVRCYTISKLADDTVKAYLHDYESMGYAIDHDIELRGEI